MLLDHVGTRVLREDSPRWAVVSCDIEPEYGYRTKTSVLLDDERYIEEFLAACSVLGVPPSLFVVTEFLREDLRFACVLRERSCDVHSHSHTHSLELYRERSGEEIRRSAEEFLRFFGTPVQGYRAPFGIVTPEDPRHLAAAGYVWDSSIFPGKRRKMFDHRVLPREPFLWDSGIFEFPLAATRQRRLITLSRIKLLGMSLTKLLLLRNDLPNPLILDSHLHDFFPLPGSATLPLPLRLAYERNRKRGFVLLQWTVELLRAMGYRFCSLSELAHRWR